MSLSFKSEPASELASATRWTTKLSFPPSDYVCHIRCLKPRDWTLAHPGGGVALEVQDNDRAPRDPRPEYGVHAAMGYKCVCVRIQCLYVRIKASLCGDKSAFIRGCCHEALK